MAHPNSKKAKAKKAKLKEARAAAPRNTDDRKAELAERKVKQEAAQSKKKREKSIAKAQTYAFYGLFVLVFVVGGWFAFRPGPELVGVEKPNNDGRGHIANATYRSATPTSGPHSAQAPSCGVYSTPLDLPLAVHALEHGVVVLWFDPAQPTLAQELAAATEQWDSHIIIAPNNGLEAPIVATAWNRKMNYAAVEDGVADFVDTYQKRGPENVSCDIA